MKRKRLKITKVLFNVHNIARVKKPDDIHQAFFIIAVVFKIVTDEMFVLSRWQFDGCMDLLA